MNGSPFAGFEQFSAATDNIAAFAHVPAFNGIVTALAAALTVWFVVTSFLIKH